MYSIFYILKNTYFLSYILKIIHVSTYSLLDRVLLGLITTCELLSALEVGVSSRFCS